MAETNCRGLFVLAWCTDRRYWRYGYKWSVLLSVADEPVSPLPLLYVLESRDLGLDAYEQAFDLVENIEEQLMNESFLKTCSLTELQ